MRTSPLGARGRAPRVARFALLLVLAACIALTATPAFAISTRTLFTPTGTVASGHLGGAVANAGDVNGDGYADVIVGDNLNDAAGLDAGRAYVYFGGPHADAVADLVLTGAAAEDEFGIAVAGAGDINGDGYDDVIVGAYGNDFGGAAAGRAYVFFGGAAPDATVDLVMTGQGAGDFFGHSVAGVGDLNGDGYGDWAVGAPYNDSAGSNAGKAYFYFGGSVPDTTADHTCAGEDVGANFGYDVAAAGDVNGDGYGDAVVGAENSDYSAVDAGRAYVFFGGPMFRYSSYDLAISGVAANDHLGRAVGSAGDVNGDGYADVLVGAYANDTNGLTAGQAYVLYGGQSPDAVADLTLNGAAGDYFGQHLGPAGDVNGDGYGDFIIGTSLNDVGASNAGRAYIYFGGTSPDTNADIVLTGTHTNQFFGADVCTAGDVNGDGFDDVAVAASGDDAGGESAGRVYVTAVFPFEVLSPNGGEVWAGGRPVSVRWRGHDPADLAISLNGGLSWNSVAVGVGGAAENEYGLVAPSIASEAAMVRVSYTGQTIKHSTTDVSDAAFRVVLPTAPPATAARLALTLTGSAGDRLGNAIADAGDVNGDGYRDLVVGAPFNDGGGADAGRAYVVLGGPGADTSPDLTLTGVAAGDRFGTSVAGVGDVNRDGYDDVLVGAPRNDADGADAGRAYLFLGAAAPDATADLVLGGAVAGDQMGTSVCAAGDFNGDGSPDFAVSLPLVDNPTDVGRVLVYYGGPPLDGNADLVLSGEATTDRFGELVQCAGDLNADGFSDLAVTSYVNDAGGLNTGRGYVYFGGRAPDLYADLVMTGSGAGDNFGSVGAPGDWNGDGYDDLFLSGLGGTGRVHVYFGGPWVDNVDDVVIHGAADGDDFGWVTSAAGDVNGDGSADLLVTADGVDEQGADAGRAYVFFGGVGADAVADLVLDGAAAADWFGEGAALLDLTGDGFDDIVVGAPHNDAGGADAGRVYVHACNRYFVLAPNDGEVWNVGAAATVSWLGAEPADLWLSADAGATWQLLKAGVGGAASNAQVIQVPHLPTRFARMKVTPADPGIGGEDRSDSLFTIQSSVALLSFTISLGDGGAELAWSTEPAVGPGGLAGYRLYRVAPGANGDGVRVGPELIAECRYTDPQGAAGSTYRLVGVNGLMEELELGRASLAPAAPLAAWPLPYRGGTMNVSFAVYGMLGATGGEATVTLHDLSGRLVRTLASGPRRGGQQVVRWDGTGEDGAPVRGGIYFLRARSAGMSHQLKVVVLR